MTTLFPQIKRVDEDETSKIIKNVLFDDQDEIKLEQIFDEFMHLTQESITFSDEDDDEVEDASENGDEDDDNDNDDEEQEEEEEEDEDDDDDDDSDSDSDESDSSDSDDEEPEAQTEPPASREPTSWNLDQFIGTLPSTKPQNNKVRAEPPESQPTPEPEPQPTPETEPQPTPEPEPQPTPEPESQPTPEPARLPEPVPSPVPPIKKPTQPSGNFLVQIDLSKLKRIPTTKAAPTKAPTPTTCSSNSMMTAKALKHEADAEKDKTKQAIKYLESAMHFVLHGYEIETSTKNPCFYNDTIPLFKHVLKLSMPGSENQSNMTNLKIHTLGLRCLSLIFMRLYKMKERELHENHKIINSQQNSSPKPQADSLLVGVRPQLLSAYKRQLAILNLLKYANDYWLQADQFCDQHPAVRIFFSTIGTNCGSLTMSSQFSKLMDHVKCGLKLLRTS